MNAYNSLNIIDLFITVNSSCKDFETVVTSKQNFFINQISAGTKKPLILWREHGVLIVHTDRNVSMLNHYSNQNDIRNLSKGFSGCKII